MEGSGMILTILLLLQMLIVLTMLNPMYDVRKITEYINACTTVYRTTYYSLIGAYFSFVIYLGMYIPLQHIHTLIFSSHLGAYEKLLLLGKVEKNYIIAGFSLFLVVVIYGVRALLLYTTNLVTMMERYSEAKMLRTDQSKIDQKANNILPNVLRVKRSISYEAILCTNELKEQLKLIMKNIDYHNNVNPLTSILEASTVNFDL